jgi:hypothetical protein
VTDEQAPQGAGPTATAAEPPPPGSTAGRGRGGWRAVAAIYAVLFGIFAGAFMAQAINLAGEPYCVEAANGYLIPPGNDECVVKSSGGKTATVALGILAGAAGILSALAAILFTITGRHGRWILITLGAAAVFYGLAVAVGVDVAKH